MRRRRLFIVTFLVFGISSAPAARLLSPQDFAYALPLEFEVGGALYEFPLPAAVYQGAARPDLGDLRVFNGNDEVVPHVVRRAPVAPLASSSVPLMFFPIYDESGARIDDLSLKIHRAPDGQIVGMESRGSARGGRRVVAYVVDAAALDRPLAGLELNWVAQADDGIFRLDVAYSDNLKDWRSAVRGAAVVRLQYAGHRLERQRVELPGIKARYLRLTWPQSDRALALTAVRGVPTQTAPVVSRDWRRLAAVRAQVGEYFYDTNGVMPLDRVRVLLPDKNSLVNLRLDSRATPDAEWRLRASGLIYDLEIDARPLRQTEFGFAPAAERYWRIRLERRELGLGQPALEVGWSAHTVVFVAQGAGPYRLAYGSGRAEPVDFNVGELLRPAPRDAGARLAPRPVRAGAPQVWGGEPARRIPLAGGWKIWGLWLALGLGVAGLGWMALRLIRQLKQGPADRPADPPV